MTPWERFVSDALSLGYSVGKDPDGVTIDDLKSELAEVSS